METSLKTYLNKVVVELEELRQQKLSAYKRYKNTTGLLIKIFKVLMIASIPVSIFVPPVWLVCLGFFLLLGLLNKVKNPKSVYEHHFKANVLPKLFKTINPTFEYQPYHTNIDNLKKSGILKSSFLKGNSEFIGEDYVKGQINTVDVECNELHFYRIEKNWFKFILLLLTSVIVYPIIIIFCIVSEMEFEDIGWLSLANEEKMFYRGFLMTADFHKSFKGDLIMLPKHQKQIVDKLNLNFDTNGYKKLTLENPVVNDLFDIYTKSEQEGFYILSPSMLNAIEELCVLNSGQVPVVTFSEGKMNVLIPKTHDSFEIDIYKEITDASFFSKNLKDIAILPKLIAHFKLEDNLWSK